MSQTVLQLPTLPDVSGLTLHANPADLHHDLVAYLDYVGSRSVKRSSRDNRLPKTTLRDLARLLTNPQAADQIKEEGVSEWIALVEFLALHMKLVSFQAGTNYARDFLIADYGHPDNYVTVNEKQARTFLAKPAAEQERAIRETLITLPLEAYNELFDPSPVGRLDRFLDWGRSRSSAALADFPGARRLLLKLLAELPAGQWFSVSGLIAYLKANHRYFLLPQTIRSAKRSGIFGRYMGFNESKASNQWSQAEINESDPDSFERVEGRFVERFLESLPLLMRYVELAYEPDLNRAAPNAPHALYPQRGLLTAFRVNDRFLHFEKGITPPVRVTVQPNFEAVIVSEIYPADLLAELLPLGEMISKSTGQAGPSVLTLRLKKERVAAQVAARPNLDVIALLRRVTGQELAQNVVAELREWTQHSEVFTLYDGFGLLETTHPMPPNALAEFTVAEIAPGLRVVRRPEEVLRASNQAGIPVALLLTHHDHVLATLPDEAQTAFATPARPLTAEPKVQPVTVKREERVILRFNGQPAAFQAICMALAELRVPFETVDRELTILFSKEYDPLLEQAFQAVADRFQIQVQK